ncbi:flagellar basal body-associated FliL family protein [Paenibacillus aurantius]|uniref:Flagellar protein FliL n=1 Tax=Paenibacillus aurantius TaxID=2918900 RepID=A0AA96LKI0_9BACL|nr:flagellar basal body-associated FliL family protein [Paenibacillus aurantius]WJH33274.1 flagellar basal body-associated FliL family protein [Paenibacillus sp. CC-CFT747]WNQ13741.1 flagellar basal body-associated FliL family protein [Paenibacillus aurantius]
MLKSRLFQIVIAMLIVITLILVTFVVLWNYLDKNNSTVPGVKAAAEEKQLTAAEVKELTVPVKEILTNLSEKNKVVKASFAFELNNKKGKTEFENLVDSRVRGVLNQTLADMTAEQIAGSKGQDNLTALLMNKINSFLHDGKITQIYITEMIVQ